MKKFAIFLAAIPLLIVLIFAGEHLRRSEFIQRNFGSAEKKEFYRKLDLVSSLVRQDIKAHKEAYGVVSNAYIDQRYEVRTAEVGLRSEPLRFPADQQGR